MDYKDCLFIQKNPLCFFNENGEAKVRFELTQGELNKCPRCGGSLYIPFKKTDDAGHTYRMSAPCPGARLRKRMDLFNAACIPAKFRNASFDNFDLNSLRGVGATINTMFIKCIKEFTPGQRGILLEGGPGTGKTHLLCAAARYLTLELNQTVRYIDFSMLLSKIRSLYQQTNTTSSESELIDDIVSVPVLFLDELGKGRDKSNEFEMRIIDEIINRRYNDDKLSTFFASNYRDRNTSGYKIYKENCIFDKSSSKWQTFARNRCNSSNPNDIESFTQKCLYIMEADHLEDRLEPRVISRIFEMAIPIYINAPDRRAKL